MLHIPRRTVATRGCPHGALDTTGRSNFVGTAMRRARLHDAGYLKGRAKECRDAAARLVEDQGRMMLLDLAAVYEELAATADISPPTVAESKRRFHNDD
jgi:hypothetical protein